MKNVINKIKNSKGFVSIESILVIGAVVILAGLIIFFFNGQANDVKDGAGSQITDATDATQLTDKAANTTLTFTPAP